MLSFLFRWRTSNFWIIYKDVGMTDTGVVVALPGTGTSNVLNFAVNTVTQPLLNSKYYNFACYTRLPHIQIKNNFASRLFWLLTNFATKNYIHFNLFLSLLPLRFFSTGCLFIFFPFRLLTFFFLSFFFSLLKEGNIKSKNEARQKTVVVWYGSNVTFASFFVVVVVVLSELVLTFFMQEKRKKFVGN